MKDDALKEIGSCRLGIQASADEKGAFPMVRVGDLRGILEWDEVAHTSDSRADEPGFRLLDGDVLIARSGEGSVGNVAVVSDPPPKATFASYVIRLRPNEGWVGKYLAYWLKTTPGRDGLERRTQGSPIRNLSIGRLENLRVPSAALEVQRKIGSQAHETYKLVTEAELRLESAAKHLRSWTLMLEDPRMLVSSRCPWERLSDLTRNRDARRRPLNAEQRQGRPGNTPYYGASGVIDAVDGFTHDGPHLLISEDGNNLRTRQTPIAFTAHGRFWANNHVHVLEIDSSRVDMEYLAAFLNTTDLSDFLTGSTQPKLNQKTLSNLKIAVPPLDEQREFIRRFESKRVQIDSVGDTVSRLLVTLSESWTNFVDGLYERKGTDVSAVKSATTEALHAAREIDLGSRSDNRDEGVGTIDANEGDKLVRSQPLADVFEHATQVAPDSDSFDRAVDNFFEWVRRSVKDGTLTLERNFDRTDVLGD